MPIVNYLKTVLQPNVPNLVPGTSGYVRQNFFSTGTSSSPEQSVERQDRSEPGLEAPPFVLDEPLQGWLAWPALTVLPDCLFRSAGFNGGFNATQVYRGTWDYTITPTLVSRFYGGFNYFREDHGSMAISADSPQSEGFSGLLPAGYWKSKGICIPNYPECANFPIITTGDFAGLGTNGPNGSDRLVFELHEDMTKIKGSHTFKWGYFYGNSHYDGFGLQNGSGSLGFSFTGTSLPLATSQATGGGSGFASFLLGAVNNYALDTPRYLTALYRTHQAYIQDDWRVSRKLTLNLGFRYSMNIAPMSVDDKISDFSPTTPNPGAGGLPGATIFAGSGPGRIGRRNIIDNWYGGYEPRLGFAYAVNDKTTIRGSATRSFGPVAGIGQSSHNLGFAVRVDRRQQQRWPEPAVESEGRRSGMAASADPRPRRRHRHESAVLRREPGEQTRQRVKLLFNIQRQITPTSVIEVGYLATLASDITSNFLAVNQVPYRSLPASSESVHCGGPDGAGLPGGLRRGDCRRGHRATVDLRRGLLELMRPLQHAVRQQRDRVASLEALSAVHDHQYAGRRRRPDRPFHVPLADDQVRQADGFGPDRASVLHGLEAAHR